jgi:predicted ester cyclase
MYLEAFPDTHFTVDAQLADGDYVITRWTATGTQEGELMGLAPSHKRVTVTGITIDRFEGGKVVESWSNWDTMGMMQQLGAVPAQA